MRILLILLAAATVASPAHEDKFRIGPGGVRVEVESEYYLDQHHKRQTFEVPADWRDYHHPLGWYRVHTKWWTARDWYRGDAGGIDAAPQQSETRE